MVATTMATIMVAMAVPGMVVAVAAEVLVVTQVDVSSSRSRRTMMTEARVQHQGRKTEHVSALVKWDIG